MSGFRAGRAAIRNLLALDLKPRDIMTREAFENADGCWVTVLGGFHQRRFASHCHGTVR